MSDKISTFYLKMEIISIRKKLDSLLETQNLNSAIVLDVSRKLDMLIIEYYNSSKIKQIDNDKPMS